MKVLAWICGFALIGAILLLSTHAAPSSSAIEPEAGVLTGNVSPVFDSGKLSGGQAIKFNTPTSTMVTLPNPGVWANVTNQLAGIPADCGTLTFMAVVPGTNKLLAATAKAGIWQSTNGGTAWVKLGTGTGSEQVDSRPNSISFDPANPQMIWYMAGTWGGAGTGVYKTTDGGQTFHHLGNLSHIDYVSVDFADPQRKTMVAGGHEQSQAVFKSTDSGVTWVNIGLNLPAETAFSSAPILLNAQTYVVSAINGWGGGITGMFRTTNGGTSWTKVSDIAATGTTPIVTSTGTIYWPTGGSLAKSIDGGVNWTTVGNGNIQNGKVTELPDGRIVAASASNRLNVTANGGQTWTDFGANMPFNINDRGVIYSPADDAFYIWQWTCGAGGGWTTMQPDSMMMLK